MAPCRTVCVASAVVAQIILAQAYPCPAAMKAVSDSATKKCTSTECSKDECCVDDDTKCGNSLTTTVCDSGKAMEYGSAGKNKEECCTLTSVKCDTMTCSAPWKDKANKDTIDCSSTTCSKDQCCDPDPDYCAAHTCGSGKYKPLSKMIAEGKTDADCCEEESKCSDFDCNGAASFANGDQWVTAAVYQTDSSKKDNTYNPENTGDVEWNTCCEPKPSLCAYMLLSCGTGKVSDGPVEGNDKDTCCRDAPICETYAPATDPGVHASGAEFGSDRSWLVAGAAVVMASLM